MNRSWAHKTEKEKCLDHIKAEELSYKNEKANRIKSKKDPVALYHREAKREPPKEKDNVERGHGGIIWL